MRYILLSITAIWVAGAAQADCFAHYKAKQDNPLNLHYGIVQLPGTCPAQANAQAQVSQRLQTHGWTLLTVVSLSETQPSQGQIDNAGQYYLRF